MFETPIPKFVELCSFSLFVWKGSIFIEVAVFLTIVPAFGGVSFELINSGSGKLRLDDGACFVCVENDEEVNVWLFIFFTNFTTEDSVLCFNAKLCGLYLFGFRGIVNGDQPTCATRRAYHSGAERKSELIILELTFERRGCAPAILDWI